MLQSKLTIAAHERITLPATGGKMAACLLLQEISGENEGGRRVRGKQSWTTTPALCVENENRATFAGTAVFLVI